jgi:hypothetical protein
MDVSSVKLTHKSKVNEFDVDSCLLKVSKINLFSQSKVLFPPNFQTVWECYRRSAAVAWARTAATPTRSLSATGAASPCTKAATASAPESRWPKRAAWQAPSRRPVPSLGFVSRAEQDFENRQS